MDLCQHCHCMGPPIPYTTEILGGTIAMLCPRCRTAWHAYFLTTPVYTTYVACTAHHCWLEGRAQAGDAPALEEWCSYMRMQQQCLEELFTLGQAWVAGKVETS